MFGVVHVLTAAVGPVDDSGSEDSLLGEEVDDPEDDDIQSLTSLEDLSVLSADLLIYKAARVRNLRAMLEAIALGGNVNWVYEADVGRTPLIQAVLSVSMHSYIGFSSTSISFISSILTCVTI